MSAGFNSPAFLVSPPQEAEQLFLVKQSGTMRIIKRDIVLLESFLDIRHRISFYDERGQLNVTLHPRFADNHRLFDFYTNKRGSEFLASSASRIERYKSRSAGWLVIPNRSSAPLERIRLRAGLD